MQVPRGNGPARPFDWSQAFSGGSGLGARRTLRHETGPGRFGPGRAGPKRSAVPADRSRPPGRRHFTPRVRVLWIHGSAAVQWLTAALLGCSAAATLAVAAGLLVLPGGRQGAPTAGNAGRAGCGKRGTGRLRETRDGPAGAAARRGAPRFICERISALLGCESALRFVCNVGLQLFGPSGRNSSEPIRNSSDPIRAGALAAAKLRLACLPRKRRSGCAPAWLRLQC